ncbi:hypothetical protein CRI94_15335 [Longibacter salinarum]|uniref:Right handed beta helix domain-containing protein n=1 Tax=Longibacter salinarum TaxID=1850348 RepID=A0A2A8CU60_9BACT|nr:hypothetical protein CRI94_15335 [Longibacter salinarum]
MLRPLALIFVVALALAGCDDAPVSSPETDAPTEAEENLVNEALKNLPFEEGSEAKFFHHCTVTTDAPQAAVDAASSGDVICVKPGTYSGTLEITTPDITVTSLWLGGATIQGGDAPTGSAVRILADGVTLEGFQVMFPGGLIGISIGPNVSDVTVRHNRVRDVGPTGRLGVTGIIADGGNTGITIEGNLVEDLRNEFTSDSGFPTVNGIFANDDRADGFSNSVIRKNVVRNLYSDNATLGILLQGTVANVQVEKNLVYRLSADPDNDSDPSDDNATYDENLDDGFDGTLATFAQGVNVDASTTSDLNVTRNFIYRVTSTGFNGEAVKVDAGAEGLTLTFNDLRSEVGLNNGTSTSFDATCNYWGHPLGPRTVASNPAADDGPNRQRRSALVGDAEVQPWLVRSILWGRNLERSCVGGRGNRGGNR